MQYNMQIIMHISPKSNQKCWRSIFQRIQLLVQQIVFVALKWLFLRIWRNLEAFLPLPIGISKVISLIYFLVSMVGASAAHFTPCIIRKTLLTSMYFMWFRIFPTQSICFLWHDYFLEYDSLQRILVTTIWNFQGNSLNLFLYAEYNSSTFQDVHY